MYLYIPIFKSFYYLMLGINLIIFGIFTFIFAILHYKLNKNKIFFILFLIISLIFILIGCFIIIYLGKNTVFFNGSGNQHGGNSNNPNPGSNNPNPGPNNPNPGPNNPNPNSSDGNGGNFTDSSPREERVRRTRGETQRIASERRRQNRAVLVHNDPVRHQIILARERTRRRNFNSHLPTNRERYISRRNDYLENLRRNSVYPQELNQQVNSNVQQNTNQNTNQNIGQNLGHNSSLQSNRSRPLPMDMPIQDPFSHGLNSGLNSNRNQNQNNNNNNNNNNGNNNL